MAALGMTSKVVPCRFLGPVLDLIMSDYGLTRVPPYASSFHLLYSSISRGSIAA